MNELDEIDIWISDHISYKHKCRSSFFSFCIRHKTFYWPIRACEKSKWWRNKISQTFLAFHFYNVGPRCTPTLCCLSYDGKLFYTNLIDVSCATTSDSSNIKGSEIDILCVFMFLLSLKCRKMFAIFVRISHFVRARLVSLGSFQRKRLPWYGGTNELWHINYLWMWREGRMPYIKRCSPLESLGFSWGSCKTLGKMTLMRPRCQLLHHFAYLLTVVIIVYHHRALGKWSTHHIYCDRSASAAYRAHHTFDLVNNTHFWQGSAFCHQWSIP